MRLQAAAQARIALVAVTEGVSAAALGRLGPVARRRGGQRAGGEVDPQEQRPAVLAVRRSRAERLTQSLLRALAAWTGGYVNGGSLMR